MGAIRYRAGADRRRDWKAVVGVALLLGLVGTVVFTAVSGARRSTSALDRFRERALSADATIIYSDPTPLAQVARLPQVAALGRVIVPFFAPLGPGDTGDFIFVTSPSGFLTDVDRVRVLEGRLPAVDRVDEVAVNENLARALKLTIGEELTLRSFSAEQFASPDGPGRGPEGPTVAARVVGVVRGTFDVPGEVTSDRPSGYLSPAFFHEYGEQVAAFDGFSRVRLRDGSADVHDFGRAVARIFADDPQFSFAPDTAEVARVEDSIDVVAIGLVLFAAAAAIAGLAALAQLISLTLSGGQADGDIVAVLGMTRRGRLASTLLTLAPGLVGGTMLAVLGAALASPLMPIDVARRAEPEAGFSFDGLVLGLGGVVLLLLAVGLALIAAWRTTGRPDASRTAERSSRPSAMARAFGRAGRSVPFTTGARMAFHGGRGRAAVPVRSGLVGAMVGAAGLVGVAVFIYSQHALVHTPPLYGWNWDAGVVAAQFESGDDIVESVDAELIADPALADLAAVRISHAVVQTTYLHVLGLSGLKGKIAPTVLHGRTPASPTEVALGTATLRALDVSIGDRLTVAGVTGPLTLDVVGHVVIPSLDTDAIADEGAVMTGEGADLLMTTQNSFSLLFNWAPDVDRRALQRRLEEQFGEIVTDKPPSDVVNLERVTAIPRAFAAFLGALALLAVGHALVLTVRRRHRDLAVLKALGLGPREVAATVAWQATLLVGAGLVVGVPLGVAAGIWSWTVVTSAMGLDNRPEVPLALVVATIPIALVAASLVALGPARSAARTKVATALRVE
jgi:hypothetical protein